MKILIRDRNKLQESIVRKGYTRRGFGQAIGISHTTVVHLLNGNRNPSPPVARKIADCLEEEFDAIFFIETGYKSEQSA